MGASLTKALNPVDAGWPGSDTSASIVLALEPYMATLTIRNLPPETVETLKSLARGNHHSMEQEVRDILLGFVAERRSVLDQIEKRWAGQTRRPTAKEIDGWIAGGRA